MSARIVLVAVLVACLFAHAATAGELKISTWNLNWLTLRPQGDPALPVDVHVRNPDDFTKLRGYAIKLAADIVAFQEVDGTAAAARIFDPASYDIVTIDEPVIQQVGLAVRHGITVQHREDYAALDVEGDTHRLRDGLDATLVLPGGQKLRVLVVHLKTGCQYDRLAYSRRPQCALLGQQVAPLAAWVAARQEDGVPFLVLGDFNRVFDEKEEMGDALAAAAPMLRVTQGTSSPCWDGGAFIDHIFLGGAARAWLVPDSLRVQVFREGDGWQDRLSDHCPVSVRLDPSPAAPAAAGRSQVP